MDQRRKICLKTGRPVVDDVICKLCLRSCPRAGRAGRKRSSGRLPTTIKI